MIAKNEKQRYLSHILIIIVFISLLYIVKSANYVSPESQAQKLIELINQYRVAHGLKPLTVSPELTLAAQRHSEDMANRDYFSHYTPEGLSPVNRVVAAGYTNWVAVGENIAAGYFTPEDVFNAWKNSPGHNRVMLNPAYKEIGIGVAYNPSSTYKIYWTADFGARSTGYSHSRIGGYTKTTHHTGVKSYIPPKKTVRISVKKITNPEYNFTKVFLIKALEKTNLTVVMYDVNTGEKVATMTLTTNETGYALLKIDLNYTGILKTIIVFKGNKEYAKSITTLLIETHRYYRVNLEGKILVNGTWLNNTSIIVEEGTLLTLKALPGYYIDNGIGIIKVFYSWNDGIKNIERHIKVTQALRIYPIYTVLKTRYLPV